MDNSNKTEETETENSLSCDLTGLPSFILQFVLGLVAISTLLSKYFYMLCIRFIVS